jgi:chromosome partitioning protein
LTTTISIALQKGGNAKTTTAQTLASILGSLNKKVLLVDMDSQTNATEISGVEDPEKTIIDVLSEECSAAEAIIECSGFDLLPAHENLANLESIEDIDSTLLKDALASVKKKYDYIIIDTPPALGNILKTCLMASDFVIIPSEPRKLSLTAIDALMETVDAVKKQNKRLKVLGILIVRYDDRSVLNKQIKDSLMDKAKDYNTSCFKSIIRHGIAVAEAQTMDMPLLDYAPKSNPCSDYIKFAKEVIKKVEG